MTRREGWESSLLALLDDWADAPFEYGKRDCAGFAAAVVEAQTGKDFYKPFRGRYKSAAGAARALRLYGAGDLSKTLTAALGGPVAVAFAGRGDVVMNADGNAGVCLGLRSQFVSDDGPVTLPTLACAMAWKV